MDRITPRAALLLFALCLSCGGDGQSSHISTLSIPECGDAFTVGGSCAAEGDQCIFPGSRCGTACSCQNEPGGFAWTCPVTTCRCTCSCGRIAIASCEALACAQESDPCPPEAESSICAVVVCTGD